MTFGFEREYFVKDDAEKFVVAQNVGLPADGCGYLAEARGDHHSQPDKAAGLLLVEERRLIDQAAAKKLTLLVETPQKLDKTFLHTAMRQFGKNPQVDRSLSGKWNKQGVSHAGLHVHFGNQRNITYYNQQLQKNIDVSTVVDLFDIAAIIWSFDREFGKVIKKAQRATGLYKMQPHGFEYRSLPATTSPFEVADFIRDNRKNWIG